MKKYLVLWIEVIPWLFDLLFVELLENCIVACELYVALILVQSETFGTEYCVRILDSYVDRHGRYLNIVYCGNRAFDFLDFS